VIDVPEDEVTACRTSRDWARRFIALNPDATAFDVVVRYGKLSLTPRLGHLDFKMVEILQAEVGAAGLTPAKLDAMEAERKVRTAKSRERLARYRNMSTAELVALPDDECARAVMARFAPPFGAVSAFLPVASGTLARARAPVPVKRAQAACYLDAEVCNGGFDQLFHNATDSEIEAGLEGLLALGASEAAEVVARARARERSRSPRRRKGDREWLRDAELEPLDKAYYAALPRADPVSSFAARLAAYVRVHPEGF
jgi:hypothetical protein